MTQDEVDFMKFVTKYRRSYGTKEEYQFRLQQFKLNKEKIAIENAKNGSTSKVGINKFSDWTHEEYKRLLGFKPQPYVKPNFVYLPQRNLKDAIDWRS